MAQLEKEIFVCIDCEMTGLDAQTDRIIEVAAVSFNMDMVFGEFCSLINPECIIPETSIAIHHITQDMVQDKPTISQVLPELLKFIGRHIIIGHGVGFDIDVIALAAERCGMPCTLLKIFTWIHCGWPAFMGKALSIPWSNCANISTLSLKGLIVQ